VVIHTQIGEERERMVVRKRTRAISYQGQQNDKSKSKMHGHGEISRPATREVKEHNFQTVMFKTQFEENLRTSEFFENLVKTARKAQKLFCDFSLPLMVFYRLVSQDEHLYVVILTRMLIVKTSCEKVCVSAHLITSQE